MKRTLMSLLGGAVLAVGLPVATATPALAHSTGYAQIQNRDWSDTCLEVDQGRGWNGAEVTVDYCSKYGQHSYWQLVDLGNGYHRVVVAHTGKCLDVRDGSHNDGAQIEQQTCSSYRPSQQWKHVSTSYGYFQLVARHSGKCLDKSWWNTVQWNCHGANWQQWRLR